jgi:pSer/pThr/pTyr-binding forkhead associated (FHA) protein
VISRIHARVIRRENGWFLEDLNSRNGTYVNGKLTAPGGTPLSDGDKVRFADEGFIFRIQ